MSDSKPGRQLLELVKDVPFFQDFTQEEKLALTATGCAVVRYHANEEIIVEGEMDRILYILIRGEVGITKFQRSSDANKKPKKVVIAKLSCGSVFGEIALINKNHRASGAQANGEVIALKIDGDMLERMEPALRNKIQIQLIAILAKRLEDMNNQMTDLVQWLKM